MQKLTCYFSVKKSGDISPATAKREQLSGNSYKWVISKEQAPFVSEENLEHIQHLSGEQSLNCMSN